jgi:K319-like protein
MRRMSLSKNRLSLYCDHSGCLSRKLLSMLLSWALVMSSLPSGATAGTTTSSKSAAIPSATAPVSAREALPNRIPNYEESHGVTVRNLPEKPDSSRRGRIQLASLRTPMKRSIPTAVFQTTSGFSSIVSNFNGTAIPASDFIWFNSVFKAGSLGSSTVRIFLRAASIQFSAGGTSYNIPVPDALITFSPTATTASTNYDPNKNEWITTVPTGLSGNTFLSGVTFPVPVAGLPGGINPVTWTGTFYSDTSGVSINWQWAAAVYKSFASDYQMLGIKPVDDPSASQYKNSDHAGTPENYKSFVTGGARGGGGSNYTGSYSATAWIAPIIGVPNYPPVANAGPDQTTQVTDTVQLNGTGSTDRDGDPLTYRWGFVSEPSGSTAVLNNANTVEPTFTVDRPGSYVVQLIVNDGKVDSTPSDVTITTINSAPVANAGNNQTVHVTDTVTLDGSGSSDVDGDPLTFSWVLTSPPGSLAQLSSTAAVKPTFVVDTKGTYTAQLIVNDGKVNSLPSTVTITTENSPPVANAGPNQTIQAGQTVQLDGSGSSDVDGDPLTFRWAIISPVGTTATLSDPTAVKPTFIADAVGTYVVQLIVNDGVFDSLPVTVTITTLNSPPVANAGADQTVFVGNTVTLDGSRSSDVDGDPLTYRWSLTAPQTSTAQLLNPTSVNPTFVVDVKGTYVAQLIVNDGLFDSNPATVAISTENSPPVANAGSAQTVVAGNTVHLNGSGSTDVDGDPLTFSWAFTSMPAGSTAVLSDPTAVAPTFFADLVGTYVLRLIVNDGTVDSAPSSVSITTQDSPPTANAGPAQTVPVGALVTLDGSASFDPDGQALTFQWSLSSPAGSTAVLANPTSVNPTFTADVPGNYVAQLIVKDGFVSSAPSTVAISTINSVPVANAGPNQTVLTGATVQLDGSASSDADHDPLTYKWALTVFPTASKAALSNTTVVNPTFVPDLAGTYVAQLIVNDGKVDSAPATVMIIVGTPVLQLAAPAATTAIPGQTLSLIFVATNTGIFDAQQVVFASGTTTVPLGIIPVGQSQPAAVSFTVPVVAPKGATDTDATYLSVLQAADNQNFPVRGSVTWSDQAAKSYAPVTATASVTEQLPVITVALSAPATAQAGLPIAYTATLTNVGHASGTVSTFSITLPDGTVQTPGLSPSALAAGASTTATVQFSVPASQTNTISALAQVSWQDGNANSYGSLSANAVTQITGIAPTVLASCVPSGSMSVMIQNGTVVSYVPNGTWGGAATGVRLAQLEGPGADPVSIATPKAVNSCSSNSVTGQTVCTSNGTDVYLLRDSAVTNTLISGSTGTARFSGGTCQTCGVTINAATNQAVLAVGLAGSSPSGIPNTGIQFLDLSTNTLSAPVPTTSGVPVSEDISVDPVRNLILSPSEQSTYELFQIGSGAPTVFDQHVTSTSGTQLQLDSSAEDCTTGIALASVESGGGIFIADLTQGVFTPRAPNTWTDPGQQFQPATELGVMDGIAVAPGSHVGIAAAEQGDVFAAFQLPTTSGTGVPAVQDWVRASIPNPGEPVSTRFITGLDPHTITAYVSPSTGKAFGVLADAGPRYLAIVDLQAMLALPRSSAHIVDSTIDLIASGVVRFVPVLPILKEPASPSSGPQGAQNLAVEIRGAATHFAQGVTTVSFGSGIGVASVTVNSPTDLTAIINIDPITTTGPRVITVATGSEVLSTSSNPLLGAFSVTQGPATISQVSPPSAAQQQTVTVTITGSATHSRRVLRP